jgi:ribosome recycling factor
MEKKRKRYVHEEMRKRHERIMKVADSMEGGITTKQVLERFRTAYPNTEIQTRQIAPLIKANGYHTLSEGVYVKNDPKSISKALAGRNYIFRLSKTPLGKGYSTYR